MFKKLWYILCLFGYWRPSSVYKKINILMEADIDVYALDDRITTVTNNVVYAIELMNTIVNSEYTKEYVIPTVNKLTVPSDIYLSKWYTSDGMLLDGSVIKTWLSLFSKVLYLYNSGLKYPNDTKAYRNSVKLHNLITEGLLIIDKLFKY